jgi:hypothetical protein
MIVFVCIKDRKTIDESKWLIEEVMTDVMCVKAATSLKVLVPIEAASSLEHLVEELGIERKSILAVATPNEGVPFEVLCLVVGQRIAEQAGDGRYCLIYT